MTIQPEIKIKDLARKHAMINAVRHQGRAEPQTVFSKVLGEKPELRGKAKEVYPLVKEIVDLVNSMKLEEIMSKVEVEFPEALEVRKEKVKKTLPPLPDAKEGDVVTRFPPEPSGYLHVGHAKAAIIDETYALMYKGKFILRFDDTNPANVKLEYYGAIREGLDWLGVKPNLIKNTSDDIRLLYEYAKKLIKEGFAYVCVCKVEEVRSNRLSGIECRCRVSSSVERNLESWEKILGLGGKDDEAILRFRGDMKSPNTALRDPTLFRIVDEAHPLKGVRYRVWPTYDFSAPIEDALDGVTHALRTKEYELRDELYFKILDALGLRRPHLIEFSRLELRGTVVSKRKIRQLINEGVLHGWDDPRLPNLLSLKRRGFLPESIREFVISLGVTKTESEPTWDLLESMNRKRLDPLAKRYYFVPNHVRLRVREGPQMVAKIAFHPNSNLGERKIFTHDEFFVPEDDLMKAPVGKVVRLMELFNVRIVGNEGGAYLGEFSGKDILEGIPKIQWATNDAIDFEVLVPGPLYVNDESNPKSLTVVKGKAEEAAQSLKVGEIVQFPRFGFCRIDGPGLGVFTHS